MKKILFPLLASLFIVSPLLADAHRSGCHRWHSCPSDSGSYTCGDAGYPCAYPTYPASGGAIFPPSGKYKDCYDCAWKQLPSVDARVWKKPLQKGSVGADVVNLQSALQKEGLFPSEDITGYYGILSERAVQQFQTKHNIVSYGTPSSTGYGRVGWSTLAKLNTLYQTI